MINKELSLASPLRIGNMTLGHRIVYAPITRQRATDSHAPMEPIVKDYYTQRASVPGTLLITEATFISQRASGYDNHPGVWSDEQLAAWRKITDAVHEKGSHIVMQLWALGRAADEDMLKKELGAGPDDKVFVSSSDVPMPETTAIPRPLEEEEIWEYVREWGVAAKKAVEIAGFDGVEIHGAHGYLIDQFTQDVVNKRTDKWGGSIENRARFAIEVAKSVASAIGPERTGIRLSPYNVWQGMKMADPQPQFTHLISELSKLKLAYLHLVESRVSGIMETGDKSPITWAMDAWDNVSPVIVAGGYKPDTAEAALTETYKGRGIAIAFGRYFTSNPDLPFRIFNGIELTPYDRRTFYLPKSPEGYATWPFSKEFLAEHGDA